MSNINAVYGRPGRRHPHVALEPLPTGRHFRPSKHGGAWGVFVDGRLRGYVSALSDGRTWEAIGRYRTVHNSRREARDHVASE